MAGVQSLARELPHAKVIDKKKKKKKNGGIYAKSLEEEIRIEDSRLCLHPHIGNIFQVPTK